jgi:uncharacterized delta-60 repeat protein
MFGNGSRGIRGVGLALALLCVGAQGALGAAKLDRSFSGDGRVLLSPGMHPSLAVQPNGKLVLAGTPPTESPKSRFIVMRLERDGRLDRAFSGNGIRKISIASGPDYARSVALQRNGKIVVAGVGHACPPCTDAFETDAAVTRLNKDGSLDRSFSGDGRALTDLGNRADAAYEILVGPEGRIVLVGAADLGPPYATPAADPDGLGETPDYSDLALAAYRPDGSPDPMMGDDGTATFDASGRGHDWPEAAAVQGDGKIVVAPANLTPGPALIRFNPDGSLDTSFGQGGYVPRLIPESPVGDVELLGDGRLLTAFDFKEQADATSNGRDTVFARYLPNGSLDSSFGNSGLTRFGSPGTQDTLTQLASQGAGFVAAGTRWGAVPLESPPPDLAVMRFGASGSPDTAFADPGPLTTDFSFRSLPGRTDSYRTSDQTSDLEVSGGRVVVAGFNHAWESPDTFGPYATIVARYRVR